MNGERGIGSGRLPRQTLGEARAAVWVHEQEETRRRERLEKAAKQTTAAPK